MLNSSSLSILKKLPTCFYRGVHGEDISQVIAEPFKRTYNRLPTFTDCPDIAQSYAIESNDGNEIIDGAVGMYRLEMNNPIFLPSRVTYQDIKNILIGQSAITKAFEKLALAVDWYCDDEEVIGILEDLEANSDEIYCVAYGLCDQPELIPLLKKSGYDSLLYEGDFTSSYLFNRPVEEVEKCSSFDSSEDMAIEYRVFKPEQVKPYYEENIVSVSPQVRMLVNKFVDDYKADAKNHLALSTGLEGQSGIIAKNLALFLNKHKLPAKVMLTQGMDNKSSAQSGSVEQENIKNYLVHAAVSIGDLVIDLALSELGDKDPKFLNKQAHLSNWKWLISEKIPEQELESISEDEFTI